MSKKLSLSLSLPPLLCGLVLAGVCQTVAARPDKSHSTHGNVGPREGVSVQSDHVVDGASGSTKGQVSGPKGRNATLDAQSSVTPVGGSGSATVQTSGGRSATASGQASVRGNTVSGSGQVQTASGRGATATGSATKTNEGVSGQGTVTTNSGKSAEISGSGNKAGGSVSVSGAQGSKTVEYGDQRK